MAGRELARQLMAEFARRTGLSEGNPQRRYLWTDAFAVCNFLGLGERDLAARLIDAVHLVLGHHRPDDARKGWLGGASDEHPTRGGLRIGKPLPERREDQRFDERLEWERDGQYFHYLTRWMHALDQAGSRAWARELMDTAQKAFTRRGRIVWKMSIDLSRPLVPSAGQHDPLDGYLTCLQLGMDPQIFALLIEGGQWDTTDALGIGSLLCDALRAQQLVERGTLRDETLLHGLLRSAARSLESRDPDPPWARVPFREAGLAIGLRAASLLSDRHVSPETRALLDPVLEHAQYGSVIDAWCLRHRGDRGWAEHQDINDVMLATSLAPRGYLETCSPVSSV